MNYYEVKDMKLKLFYRTQRELATALNELVDSYHEETVDEQVLIKGVTDMYENNKSKLLKDGNFTTVVQQQCGKRRLEIVQQIINKEKME